MIQSRKNSAVMFRLKHKGDQLPGFNAACRPFISEFGSPGFQGALALLNPPDCESALHLTP